MGDSNVVKSGKINLQQKSLWKTQWVEKFCVLYGKSAQNHPYMDFYESYEAYIECKNKTKKCDKTIELIHIKAIKQSSQKSSQGGEYLIEIHAKRSKHFFMLKRDSDCRDWADKLTSTVDIAEGDAASSSHSNDPEPDYPGSDSDDDDCDLSTINQMYESSDQASRFEVVVEESPLTTLCGIKGRVTLLVGHTELAFENSSERKILYSFSYSWLRRYGKKAKDIFHFEVGRKCPNGVGEVLCKTSCSKDIHKLVSQFSSNKSTTKTPAAPGWMKQNADPATDSPPIDRSGIGGPSLVANTGRKHPGQSKVPTLVPLPGAARDTNSVSSIDTDLQDMDIGKGHKHSSGKFKKELEEKLSDDHHHHNLRSSEKENDSKKSKQKEEKKSKENKDKVSEKSKKEQETEKKIKHKEEKKSVFGGLFSSKKDKEKGKEPEKVEQPKQTFSGNIYEEPDLLDKQNNKPQSPTGEALYDVADLPPSNIKEGYVYDDVGSVSRENQQYSTEPVEYAQPFVQPNQSQANSYVYADAKEMKTEAWRQLGRAETEEHHEDNYSVFKNVQNEIKQSPPLPTRNYDEDEEDDTYDRTDNIMKQSNFSDNVYGTASRPVGDLVAIPPAKTNSDSEGENLYDEAEYATAEETRAPLADTYEEAVVKPYPKLAQKPSTRKPHTEALYEEVNM